MKKITGLLLGVLLVFGFAFNAGAAPMTWTDSIDFNPDVRVPPTLSYFHDISDDGFSSFATGGDDTISGFNLSIELYDDNAGKTYHGLFGWTKTVPDGDEMAVITVSLLDWNWFDIDGNTAEIDTSFAGTIDILHDGTLNISIASSVFGGYGDFMVDSSYLEVYGDDGTAPVPEPATMLLLGSGLLGFAVRRKKK